jgi:hypothetical protein
MRGGLVGLEEHVQVRPSDRWSISATSVDTLTLGLRRWRIAIDLHLSLDHHVRRRKPD